MPSHIRVARGFAGLPCCLLSLALLFASQNKAVDWPEFRGPTGQGHASDANLPLSWSEGHNVAWKVSIPGKGWSSPAILGDQLWLTTATNDSRSLRALALDPRSGRILHNVEVFHYPDPPPIHKKNSYASPTPVLEDDRIYVHFGTQGTAALNRSGEIIWKTRKLRYYHRHGSGGSPAISGDLLFINCDGYDLQYVVALDKNNGRIRWKTYRLGAAQAYVTPLVIENGGSKQLISPGANRAVAYDIETGQEIWSVRYKGYSNVPRPVFGHGLVYIISGFDHPILYAVRPDGRGNITSSHVVWSVKQGVSLTPSPLLVGDELYMVSDRGIASCLDAKTGRRHWRARLNGDFSASPLFADGRIYFLNETGETTILKAGRKYHKLKQNQVDGGTFASLAVADSAIFLRTDTHLYRIEDLRPQSARTHE